MASKAGMRRLATGESQKGEREPIIEYIQRPSFQQKTSKSRSVWDWQGVLSFVSVAIFTLLVIHLGFSFLVLDPASFAQSQFRKKDATILRVSSFDHSQSRKENETTLRISSFAHHQLSKKDAYGGAFNIPSHPRNALIVAGEMGRGLNSARHCVADVTSLGFSSKAYHSPKIFFQDFQEMLCKFKIFVYPHSGKDRFKHIFQAYFSPPTGNYASEHYFKMALLNSSLITKDPSEADLFYLPFSIARMRNDPVIGVDGIKHFVKDYVTNISLKYPYWNRSSGADHFYVNCHSIGRTATETALHVRTNAIQVVCSSTYHLQVYFPHKDATIPQVWPRTGFPKQASSTISRKTLAFFAGAANSQVRAELAKHWSNDSEIKVYTHRINTPYNKALLTSKYCLHAKGFEVNTARLADAIYYGCVPVIIADYHDLPFNDVLDWSRFSLVVASDDIARLKEIIKGVNEKRYQEMQKSVMQVRQHFQWHANPQPFDAFYMVMYELWLRRHVVRFSLPRPKHLSRLVSHD